MNVTNQSTTVSRILWFSTLLLCLLSAPTLASNEEKAAAEGTGRIDQLKQALEAEQSQGFAPTLLPTESLEPETAQAMQQALKAYYDYRIVGYEHRKSVFTWQLLSSKMIFVIVILLVTAGIYFSWLLPFLRAEQVEQIMTNHGIVVLNELDQLRFACHYLYPDLEHLGLAAGREIDHKERVEWMINGR